MVLPVIQNTGIDFVRGLKDKVVVVTGGGGGIGGATCRRFSEEGAKVAVFDVDAAASAAVARAIVQNKGNARAFTCDVAKHTDCQKAVHDAEAALGAIDVLVNNAGWDVFRPFVETSPVDWDKIISINLTGALNMHHALLPGMMERKRGRIVNVSSDCGTSRLLWRGGLRCLQGRPDWVFQDHCPRTRSQRHYDQRRVSWCREHKALR